MSTDILGANCDQCVCMVQCWFTSTETIRFIRARSPGRPPRLSHSSWSLRDSVCPNSTLLFKFRVRGVVCNKLCSHSRSRWNRVLWAGCVETDRRRRAQCLFRFFFFFFSSGFSSSFFFGSSFGGGDSSVVRAPDSWSKGRGFESLQERRENFLLHGKFSYFGIRSTPVLQQ